MFFKILLDVLRHLWFKSVVFPEISWSVSEFTLILIFVLNFITKEVDSTIYVVIWLSVHCGAGVHVSLYLKVMIRVLTHTVCLIVEFGQGFPIQVFNSATDPYLTFGDVSELVLICCGFFSSTSRLWPTGSQSVMSNLSSYTVARNHCRYFSSVAKPSWF